MFQLIRQASCYCALLFAPLFITESWAQEPESKTRVLVVVGPSNHPPGSHEVAAGGRLLEYCLERANLTNVNADVVYQWPHDKQLLESTDSVVFIGDTFPPERFPDSETVMTQLDTMMSRGCGIVCIHYATGLRAEDVAPDGEHPLLHWLGGYFATRCPHHRSIAKIYPKATINPAAADHPVSRGWRDFTLLDEPYINNYFGGDQNRLAPNVTALATSMLPPENPQREVVAWGIDRDDGGRGFGIVMPHFYRNWKIDHLRTFILNGIIWTAQREVPAAGMQSELPNLSLFEPESIEPKPRRKK